MYKVDLKSSRNMRDFGGTVNRRNETVRSRRFLRSAALDGLTPEDAGALKTEYGVVRVIDLRTDEESSERPDVRVPGAELIHIPLLKGSTLGITHENQTDGGAFSLASLPDLRELYRLLVTDSYSVSQLKKVFEAILSDSGGAVLWHCSEGKDRCGIVSALFLSVLDADRKTIVEDYLLTNDSSAERAESHYRKVLELTSSEETAEKVRNLFLADKSYLDAAFSAAERQWGSVDAFIERKLGITADAKQRFQEKVLLEK